MPTTTNLELPYPTLADTADVPGDIQALADQLDKVIPQSGSEAWQYTATGIMVAGNTSTVHYVNAPPGWLDDPEYPTWFVVATITAGPGGAWCITSAIERAAPDQLRVGLWNTNAGSAGPLDMTVTVVKHAEFQGVVARS